MSTLRDTALENKHESLNALYEAEERAVRRNLELEQEYAEMVRRLIRAGRQVERELEETAGDRHGDPNLLVGKEWVPPQTAGQYLSVGVRQIQKLVRKHRLVRGGTDKKPLILTRSLEKYFASPGKHHK